VKTIALIGLALLSATSAVANVGDSIEESLQRYGELCLIDHNQDRLIWDTGKVTYVATFDASRHCDMMEVFLKASGQPQAFAKQQIDYVVSQNMVGANTYHEVRLRGRRCWRADDPLGPVAYYAPMKSPLSGKWLFCIQVGTPAGYKHLGEIYARLHKQASPPEYSKPEPKKFY
jgi:hypothetical protein